MIRFSMLTDLGNYLRVRGEYSMTVTDQFAQAELPPRTRRILRSKLLARLSYGTTSAYAENTSKNRLKSGKTGNYLRVRGEYGHGRLVSAAHEELPPRTRRIRIAPITPVYPHGTTSAYAENTTSPTPGIRQRGNYLRVRGEYKSR